MGLHRAIINPNTCLMDDFDKIESLHQQDMKAAKSGDYKTLRSLLSPDAVMMPPGQPWIRGAEQLEENYQHMEKAMKKVKILEYEFTFEEVTVLGDYAFEWGTIFGISKEKGEDPEETTYKLMRILKKDEQGEWKVHRAIWNENPA